MERFRAWLPAAIYLVVWLLLSALAAGGFFLTSERTVEVASHEARVQPSFSGQVVVRTGAVLPDVRTDSGGPVGVEIELGKTDARSVEQLTSRYAAIGSNPDAQIAKVRHAVEDMAIDAVTRGLAFGLIPLLVWVLLGERRRKEIVDALPTRNGVVGLVVVALVVIGLTTPWRGLGGPGRNDQPEHWVALRTFVGPDVELPDELQDFEVLADTTTHETQRLVRSAIDSYKEGREFYAHAAETASELELREPEDGETVVLLLSDRHDNVGMDQVARAIAERAGATAVFDTGDDTSTGEKWEAFSLDSLDDAFDDGYDGWAVAGNHDHGRFVRSYLSDLGWHYFDDGDVLDGPGDTRLMGADDPRSSGLGSWQDETGLTFDEVRTRLADAACAADDDGDRIDTLLVHDVNLGREALDRGCVDLVVGGHTHTQYGPALVEGPEGERGYTYTVGTAGGASYAIALGVKLRRPAGYALITYRDGEPVGIQTITVQTTGRFDVAPFEELTY
ncbi:metallophosphoesterase [Nocardioides humilatus]|uniref:Metallophosphoesterase n=1 Tax=Nocardioides humilatus TaxID=2607660 RepID=A0A5B1LLS5_9ACTN|nr:metallophosphoesterase [Nocardioides humilatus]KAA1421406.1 metallophosphoesterase [Nocardioides humilatus]